MTTSAPVSFRRRDVFWLLGWAGLLLVCSQLDPSLMAHDEGSYALESRFMLDSSEWLARQSWGVQDHARGILLNWLMMVCYQLFGVGAQVSASWAVRIARLPTMVACLGAVVLTYNIGKLLFAQQGWRYAQQARWLGLLSGLLLMVFSTWTQYSHLATQDMLLVSAELLGVWALLKAEQTDRWRRIMWGFVVGSTFGLGYLIKTFMVVLPAIALLPYLIFEQRRHRHLTNPGFYAGLIAGMVPVVLWVTLSVRQYGNQVLAAMFGKVGTLSAESFHPDGGPLYYLWNIPANMMPWWVFAVIGLGMVLRAPGFWRGIVSLEAKQPYPHRWLFLYPLLLLGMLMLFPTKTAYYALQLHPWLAYLSAIALHTLATQRLHWPRQLLSYVFAAIGCILLLLPPIVVIAPIFLPHLSELSAVARPYAPLPILLGSGWVCLPFLTQQPKKWIAAWLISAWLTLCTMGLLGFLGSYSADIKMAMMSPPISPILQAQLVQDQPIGFLIGPDPSADLHKSMIIIAFHTPLLGQLNPDVATLPAGSYLWMGDTAQQLETLPIDPVSGLARFETIARVRQWRLIRIRGKL